MGSKNFLRTELRKFRIAGGFPASMFDELKRRPEAVREVAREILNAHFPESLHREIATSAGFSSAARTPPTTAWLVAAFTIKPSIAAP
jgi:hypothetical protein